MTLLIILVLLVFTEFQIFFSTLCSQTLTASVFHFEESCFWTLSIVQCFSFKKQRFGRWLCFRLQVKKEGRDWTEWLRLALSKWPHRVWTTPSPLFLPEDGSRTSFRNVVLKEKNWTMEKVQKQDSSICITPSLKLFRIVSVSPWCEITRFTPVQNSNGNYSS
jgi:hypothetical protein